MVEFIGLIKVNVVRGTNLAIRDMVSSDPYVILTLGSQVNLSVAFHISESLKEGYIIVFFQVVTSFLRCSQ